MHKEGSVWNREKHDLAKGHIDIESEQHRSRGRAAEGTCTVVVSRLYHWNAAKPSTAAQDYVLFSSWCLNVDSNPYSLHTNK